MEDKPEIRLVVPASHVTSINIRISAKKKFDELKGSRPAWQFFDEIWECYLVHQAQQSDGDKTEAIAS